MRYLILLLLASCSTHPHPDYHRGAGVRPAPAPVRPGVGAPVLGQPGYIGPEVPRAPHGRVLPPTRDPGLWAVAQPAMAAPNPWDDSDPILIGVHLPEPDENESLAPLMMTQRKRCAYLGNTLFTMKMSPEDLVGASRDVRACLAAQAWYLCALSDLEDLKGPQWRGMKTKSSIEKALRKNLADADGFAKARCTDDVRQSHWLADWITMFGREWARFNSRSAP
jgi:hypothetical protein